MWEDYGYYGGERGFEEDSAKSSEWVRMFWVCIWTSLLLIFLVNTSSGEDLKDKDSVYYVAYKMAESSCESECRRAPSSCMSVLCMTYCRPSCMDRKVPEYIRMLREAK